MPELPEVETIVRELRARVLNIRIRQALLLQPEMMKGTPALAAKFDSLLRGKSFKAIERKGKYLLFTLSGGRRLLAHLGMTGKFVLRRKGDPNPAHLCSQYHFAGGQRLDHVDVRRFGRLGIYDKTEEIPALRRLGIDPLSADFSAASLEKLVYLQDGRRRRRQAIHILLMRQDLLAGVGNIYASEALFRAGIRPQKSAGRLRPEHLQRLALCLPVLLEEAIARGGTTVSDYRRVDDKTGEFRTMLRVYNREGQPCGTCRSRIRRIRLGGRSAFYCPKCQK